MKKTDLSRRDFNRLSAAAFGGVVAGSLAGCGDGDGGDADGTGGGDGAAATGAGDAPPQTTDPTAGETPAAEHDVAFLMEEPHVCRGLNTCENKGASGENACAGQGTCATATAHTCHYQNECKGQGGCGDFPGQNACSEKGECGVPLSSGAWEKARAAFEAAMADADNAVGAAPAPE